jgi:hypothetical protein
MKQEKIERLEVYYEQIQKLILGLQVPTIDNLLIIVCSSESIIIPHNCDCKDETIDISTT